MRVDPNRLSSMWQGQRGFGCGCVAIKGEDNPIDIPTLKPVNAVIEKILDPMGVV